MWHCLLCCTRCVVLTFESVDEFLVRDHSNESYWAVLSCGTVMLYKVRWCVTIQMKANQKFFHVVLFIMLYTVVLTFKSVEDPGWWSSWDSNPRPSRVEGAQLSRTDVVNTSIHASNLISKIFCQFKNSTLTETIWQLIPIQTLYSRILSQIWSRPLFSLPAYLNML